MQEVIEKTIQNARDAGTALDRLAGKLKAPDLLWEYFHLRPTSDGVTIVSHHPLAPMWGANCTANALEDKLLGLDSVSSTLAAEHPDRAKVLAVLDRNGFECDRKQTENPLEADVQAAFISGMIAQGAEYEGIRFLASELILQDDGAARQNRFDVVGYKDHTLCIFELKRKRDTGIYEQIERYSRHFASRRQEFEKLLAAYPRTACPEAVEIRAVKYIAVMKDARLSPYDWAAMTRAAGVDTWLFRPALAFRKL